MPQENNSVKRALEILNLVSIRTKGITFSEIARELDVPKSSLTSLVHTLAVNGYIRKNEDSGKYSIGIMAFEVGTRYRSNNYHKDYIVQSLGEVAKIVNETVHYGVLDKKDVVYLEKFESSQPITMSSSVGRRMPAHSTAIGKSLLSGYSDNELRRLYSDGCLEKLQENTITHIEKLILQMHEIRAEGYSWENCESSQDVYCLAAPLKNSKGTVVAAMSISFPIFRLSEEKLQISINLLRECAEKLTIYM